MKKIISIALVMAVIMSVCSFSASAQSEEIVLNERIISTTTEYLDDGTIIEITVSESDNGVMPLADSYVKSGYKTYTCKNSDGTELWWFKLTGQYDVTTGVSAVCTHASYTYSILNDNWSLDTASTSKSGNKATGTATFKRKVLFITAETKDVSISLTCSNTGVLS